ncbi:hypothetical protein VC83_07361 [Pseudogymnoascus destructans]|uniref:Uncharacterized protein n=1 Tax=Pseudogymnoascus destructans TaxID=655981 RepID=A0A177A1Z9_9PEZI|nr:uncharacterized protein VC83_07361 [Pseudogymnoascus destructans]OAF56188.1 hypothetical protein VC83_07361 [Pseudogymnoascus destructans]
MSVTSVFADANRRDQIFASLKVGGRDPRGFKMSGNDNSNFYQCQFRRPPGALSGASRVLCLRCLWAKASGVKDHDCVWSPASSKCEYCTAQHSTCVLLPWFLGEEYRVLFAAEVADPWDPAAIEAAAAEANWCDSYEELRATRATIVVGLAQIRSSLRRLRTEQGSVPALLGEVMAAVGRLTVVAVAATVPDRAGGRKKGGDGDGEGEGDGFGAQYWAEEDGA